MTKRILISLTVLVLFCVHFCGAAEKPIYAPATDNETLLRNASAPLLEMSEAQLLALVPPQPGFWQVASPGSDSGAQERNLIWDLTMGAQVQDRYSKEFFPNVKYPENGQLEVKTPAGKTQVFKFHVDKDGKKYWFEGRRWYEQRVLLEKSAYQLAQLYRLNPEKNREAGRRAALILQGFAAAYPDYIPRYDFPFRDKKFYPPGTDFLHLPEGAYRGARWYWTALGDISRELLLAYDQLAGSDVLDDAARRSIENDLLGGMVDFVNEYHGSVLGNLHLPLWRSQAIAARVLKRPALQQQVLQDMRQMLSSQFFADGFWYENTVSYHLQTVRGFRLVLLALNPELKEEDLDSYLQKAYPELVRPMIAADALRLPNGAYAAINDTWAYEKYSPPLEKSTPQLLPGMGYGVLGSGEGERQLQAHLNYSGRYGHHHNASLNLLLFANGKELVSDLGYTHTKARPWAASTASHNTVVVDGKNQLQREVAFNALGNLLLFNGRDASFQAIETTAPETYGDLVSDYRRALITVRNGNEISYVVDVFHVAGGAQHDWMLHGSADEEQQLELQNVDHQPLPATAATSFLPANFQFQEPKNEFDNKLVTRDFWAYGHFHNVRESPINGTVKATYKNHENSGLQSWILGSDGGTLFTAQAWNVRAARENRGVTTTENQAKLDSQFRQSLILRRRGETNRFVAVHVPFEKGAPPVQNITQIPWEKEGIALKIEHQNGVDYLLYQPNSQMRSGQINGETVRFDGRIALLQTGKPATTQKMIGGSIFQFGKNSLRNTPASAKLLAVRDNVFTVEGDFTAHAGEVVILQHANNRTSAFQVAKVARDGVNTLVTTQEPPVFQQQPNGALKMVVFPHLELAGEHLLISTPLAASKNGSD